MQQFSVSTASPTPLSSEEMEAKYTLVMKGRRAAEARLIELRSPRVSLPLTTKFIPDYNVNLAAHFVGPLPQCTETKVAPSSDIKLPERHQSSISRPSVEEFITDVFGREGVIVTRYGDQTMPLDEALDRLRLPIAVTDSDGQTVTIRPFWGTVDPTDGPTVYAAAYRAIKACKTEVRVDAIGTGYAGIESLVVAAGQQARWETPTPCQITHNLIDPRFRDPKIGIDNETWRAAINSFCVPIKESNLAAWAVNDQIEPHPSTHEYVSPAAPLGRLLLERTGGLRVDDNLHVIICPISSDYYYSQLDPDESSTIITVVDGNHSLDSRNIPQALSDIVHAIAAGSKTIIVDNIKPSGGSYLVYVTTMMIDRIITDGQLPDTSCAFLKGRTELTDKWIKNTDQPLYSPSSSFEEVYQNARRFIEKHTDELAKIVNIEIPQSRTPDEWKVPESTPGRDGTVGIFTIK
jgi:hypothetical protein